MVPSSKPDKQIPLKCFLALTLEGVGVGGGGAQKQQKVFQ